MSAIPQDDPDGTPDEVDMRYRLPGESQQTYNELVPPTVQPVLDQPTTDYLGNPRA